MDSFSWPIAFVIVGSMAALGFGSAATQFAQRPTVTAANLDISQARQCADHPEKPVFARGPNNVPVRINCE